MSRSEFSLGAVRARGPCRWRRSGARQPVERTGRFVAAGADWRRILTVRSSADSRDLVNILDLQVDRGVSRLPEKRSDLHRVTHDLFALGNENVSLRAVPTNPKFAQVRQPGLGPALQRSSAIASGALPVRLRFPHKSRLVKLCAHQNDLTIAGLTSYRRPGTAGHSLDCRCPNPG
jgi:hypothetical protein